MNLRRTLVPLALAVLLASGCERSTPTGSTPGASPATQRGVSAGGATGKVVARYGDQTFTADQLVVELQRLPERTRRSMNEDARRKFVDNYVLNDLLFQEGKRQGIADDPEIEQQVTDLRKRLVVQRLIRNLQNLPPVTDEQVKTFYDTNPERFSTTTIKARHILVKDEARARELQQQVKADPSKFAEIAQANSMDTASARKGGDLGFFGRGRMVPDFENAAFALKAGEVSDVVKTPYGYHIILVEEVRPGTQKPFEQVKEQIRATLHNQALQESTRKYYDEVKEKAHVTVDEAVLAEVIASLPAPTAGASESPATFHGAPPGALVPAPMARPPAPPPASAPAVPPPAAGGGH